MYFRKLDNVVDDLSAGGAKYARSRGILIDAIGDAFPS